MFIQFKNGTIILKKESPLKWKIKSHANDSTMKTLALGRGVLTAFIDGREK